MKNMCWWMAGALGLLVGCGSGAGDDTDPVDPSKTVYDPDGIGIENAADLRQNLPDAPAEGEGLQWITPTYIIPPGEERQFCSFHTHRDDTVGMYTQLMAQSRYGHHVAIMGTTVTEHDFPDGSVINCTEDADFPMDNLEPLLLSGQAVVDGDFIIGSDENGQADFELPEGMAARLRQGQRILIQSHYVNTTTEPIAVQDALNVYTVTEAEVETWAAPFVTVDTEFELPPLQETTVEFDCTVETTGHLLYIGGHMHEWGKWFELDIRRDQELERIYDIADWRPEFRDQAIMRSFEINEFPVVEGDVLHTTCHYENDTDHVIDHPQEMCVSFGMIYPSKVPIICSPPGQ